MITLIAAMDLRGTIGRDGRLPWHLPGDLSRFRERTLGTTCVMGRRTFESIGGPLPGRECVVVTSSGLPRVPGLWAVRTPEEALEWALGRPRPVSVIGGSRVYEALMPRCDAASLSVVQAVVPGDTAFPVAACDAVPWRLRQTAHYRDRDPIWVTTFELIRDPSFATFRISGVLKYPGPTPSRDYAPLIAEAAREFVAARREHRREGSEASADARAAADEKLSWLCDARTHGWDPDSYRAPVLTTASPGPDDGPRPISVIRDAPSSPTFEFLKRNYLHPAIRSSHAEPLPGPEGGP